MNKAKTVMTRILSFLAVLTLCCTVWSCNSSNKNLKVAASSVPHAQMLEYIKPDLEAQGIHMSILIVDDYNVPNRALADKEVDANFFQHLPFLNAQVQEFHFPIVGFANVELEPMGIYSKKIHSLQELKNSAVVAVPNDPTNEARALLLFQEQGLIRLKNPANLKSTVLDITENPKHLKFVEIDSAMIPRALEDVDAAAINTNYAMASGLNPLTNALVLESKNSPYVNIIAIRSGDENRPELIALKKAMTSEKMREFILQKYKGAILPAF